MIGAKSSRVRQRYVRTAADYKMIEYFLYIHETTTLYHTFSVIGLSVLPLPGLPDG